MVSKTIRLWVASFLAALVAACAHAPAPSPPNPSAPGDLRINPANIRRVGHDLPAGDEVNSTAGPGAPAAIWGLGAHWTAAPPPCAELADPGDGHGESAQGVSGSGAGGIVYAVVAAFPAGRDPAAVISGCPTWTLTNGHTSADVALIDPPGIKGIRTVGMASDITTSVEAGTEIHSRAYTFIAYLGAYYAFTTLVTDPGSAQQPLGPQFAADLLVKTVSALRG